MEVIRFPAIPVKTAETLLHTLFAVLHVLTRSFDAAIVFNAANTLAGTMLKLKGLPYALHVDGLEWKRLKWGPMGRRFYLASEHLATKSADALIADAAAISDYYRSRYDVGTVFIPYGTPGRAPRTDARLSSIGLAAKGYHLVVARFEPKISLI